MKKILIFAILMLLPLCSRAQWHLLNDFDTSLNVDIRADVLLGSIYFLDLPGPPRIGFAGLYSDGIDSNQVWKTTDGGWTWYSVKAPYPTGPFIGLSVYDFAFKDSSTGWLANYWANGGCDVTTDAGETWSLVSTPKPAYPCYAIYYHHAVNRLFAATDADNFSIVSTDEGNSWQSLNLYFVGCSFSDDSTGILIATIDPNIPVNIYYTTNGGQTWIPSNSSVPAGCVHPVAINGTKTFFIIDYLGQVSRSDDGGQTWNGISFLPPYNQTLGFQTAELFGNFQALYTQSSDGVFVSTDSGDTWQSLCGPSNSMPGGGNRVGFYERDGRIYAGEFDDATGGKLWYLSTDSLNIFSSSLHPTQSTTSGMSVLFQPQIDTTALVDTAHFAIRYDTSLLLKSLQFPPGWNLLDSNSTGNTLSVTIFDTSSTVSIPSVTLNFEPILTISNFSGTVWLDSANLYGKWMTCDIYAQSTSAPDSVQLNFTPACGDSTLLAAMQGELPFVIQSIVPNPAQNEITITGAGMQSTTVTLFDVLGREQDVRGISLQNGVSLDVSNIPSGNYYLRFSSGGYVTSRSVSIER